LAHVSFAKPKVSFVTVSCFELADCLRLTH
jgi:hypothetical protein